MRYIIFGAGAVGSCYGGLLHHGGREVVLVGRSEHVAAIRKHGLELQRIGDTLHLPILATDTLTDITPRAGDILFLAVKSQQTADAVELLKKHFPDETPVIGFQNGVHNEGLLSGYFQRVYASLVNFNANYLAPGVVRRTILNQVVFGWYPEGTDALTAQLVEDANAIGFRAFEHPHVMRLKWGKMLANLNNATLTLQNLWLQKALGSPEVVQFMHEVMEEGMTVLKAAGIEFSDPLGIFDVQQQMDAMVRAQTGSLDQPLGETPEDERSYPSTWQDLKLRRPATEVEFLNGEIVRLGKTHGIATPYNAALLEAVERSVRDGSGPGGYTVERLRTAVKARES